MNWPEELLRLTPIFDIISYECIESAPSESLYSKLPDLLIPILIGQLEGEDYCFSQVIRLCYNRANDEVAICNGYPDVLMRCSQNGSRFVLYLVDLVFLANGRMAGRHSEAVLVDNLEKIVEFFEPNGASVSWYPSVNSFLQYKFFIHRRILSNGGSSSYFKPRYMWFVFSSFSFTSSWKSRT